MIAPPVIGTPVLFAGAPWVAAARAEGLLLSRGPQFAVSHGLERFVRLPHKVPPEVVTEAMRRLGRAWRAQQSLPAHGRLARPRPVVA